jgi:uncharacterized membrane protein
MIESVVSSSALPSLHPAIIHFPIALAITALVVDIAALTLRRQAWLDASGAMLWVLAALGSVAAVLSGDSAASGLWAAPGRAQAAMADHEQLGQLTMIALLVVAALRLLVAWRSRADSRVRPRPLRLVALVACILVQLLLVRTADMGGSLVYRHGLGVTVREGLSSSTPATQAQPLQPPARSDPAQRTPSAKNPTQ